MFKLAESILNPVFSVLVLLFLVLIILRIRGIFFKKKSRTPIWKKEIGLTYMISGSLKILSFPLMAAGIVYALFIILIFTAVLYPYVKTLFIVIFSVWVILEIYMSFSIPGNLPKATVFRKSIYFLTVAICLAGATLLFPKIIQTYPFPAESQCVLLDLPVKGEWLAGHAGATILTNAHSRNIYAVDCLKIGDDGLFFKESEEDVTDFYSFNEPVYAPADGQITEVTDSLPSDHMGDRDIEHPGGNHVIMDIGNGKYFYVAHLRKGKIPVKEGQTVKKGTILGYIGNSGNTFFPHLHIHVQNNPTADQEGRITYPFRFKNIYRKRLIFWQEVSNAALIRNDRFHEK
jgi:hypothetical protein